MSTQGTRRWSWIMAALLAATIAGACESSSDDASDATLSGDTEAGVAVGESDAAVTGNASSDDALSANGGAAP
ncbi:MAG TPA: hypothetical protein VF230_19225, partial [Acidimicrobiales bacterium]